MECHEDCQAPIVGNFLFHCSCIVRPGRRQLSDSSINEASPSDHQSRNSNLFFLVLNYKSYLVPPGLENSPPLA